MDRHVRDGTNLEKDLELSSTLNLLTRIWTRFVFNDIGASFIRSNL